MNDELIYTVRVRAVGLDRFAGLKGHDYIRARQLTPRPNHSITPCAHCELMQKWPAVHRLLRRRAVAIGREHQAKTKKPVRNPLRRIA